MLKRVIFWLKNTLSPTEKMFQTKRETLSVPKLDIREKFREVTIKKDKIYIFFGNQSLLFFIKIALKTLELQILSNDLNLKESGASYRQKIVFRDNHGQDI